MQLAVAFRSLRILVVGGLVVALGIMPAWAGQDGIPGQVAGLQQDVKKLQQQVDRLIDSAVGQGRAINQLTAVVNSQSQLIGQLQQQNQGLEATLGCMSKTGNDVYFTGCNLHILSGSGATDGDLNGLGNLIIGYNESVGAPVVRTGSHNLVVGPFHWYSSYGGLVVGYRNAITAPYASVSGGTFNTAKGANSTVTGGRSNEASAPASSVSGGVQNTASGNGASVSGGLSNAASGDNTSVSGGAVNVAGGGYSSISGGSLNVTTENGSSISGGKRNIASGAAASVSGGSDNTATGESSSVSGGRENVASSDNASVSGGHLRKALGDFNWAAGGLLESQ